MLLTRHFKMFVALAFLLAVAHCYEVPPAKVEVFVPQGLRVSIPDAPGIELFAFHGQINEDFESGREAGHTGLSQDVLRKSHTGRWTFVNRDVRLRKGDKLYYWLYVQRDGKGYERLFQVYNVLNAGIPIAEL